MKPKTESEVAFEAFCQANGLNVHRLPEGTEPTPDYVLTVNETRIYVEVKQIDEDTKFSPALATRSPGAHVRSKINQARDQLRSAAQSGHSAVLLVYNNLDPLQMFGTEQHDFLAAMYGDLTVNVARTGTPTGMFHGRNQSFREGKNDSFSAVGWLHRTPSGIGVHLYENAYARVPLEFSALPQSIRFNRVQVEDA